MSEDLITTRFDLNLVVEAGAGSGKTQKLVERMAAGVACGVYRVEDIAAVTFTRKAAAELRGRFQLALEQRLGQTAYGEERQRIRQALGSLERLFTGTIHAFCAHLLRERPVEAGVAPGFTELDEIDDGLLRQRAWRDFLTRQRARDSASLRALLEAGVEPKDLDDAFWKVCTFDEVDFPAGDASAPDPAPAWGAFDTFWKAVSSRLPDPIPDETTCDVQGAARECQWRVRLARRDRPVDLVQILMLWDRDLGVTQKWWKGVTKDTRALQDEIQAFIQDFRTRTAQPFLTQWRHYIYDLAMPLLLDARSHARQQRLASQALNYGDLLQIAARLLRGNAEVREALQRKYPWLFVDEFQDTDPIQAEVLLLLAADSSSPPDWTRVTLRPGALFIVGDPKQSIYRFRRADIEIYNFVRWLIEKGGGKAVPLTLCKRSLPEICLWANGMFPSWFGGTATAEQPAWEALDSNRVSLGAAGADHVTAGVFTLTTSADVAHREVAGVEAQGIARFIRGEIDAGRRKPDDFMILAWKKSHLKDYAGALEALQVPVEVAGAGAFGDSEHVAVLRGLLAALADPEDQLALVGVIRGPLFGVSDLDLFRHRQAGGWFRFRGPASDASTPGFPSVLEALAALRQMDEWVRRLPLAAAVARILEFTGYLALAAAESPGAAEAGDLLHAIDRVRRAAERGGSLADAVEALDQDMESNELEAVPLEPGRGDVVRVMNLHKAKGLEAKVVFLADPCGGFQRRVDIRIDRRGGSGTPLGYLQIVRREGWSTKVLGEPEGWEAHEAAELPFLEAEEHRLRYVAVTRARDVLVVGRSGKAGGATPRPWAVFDSFLTGKPELSVPAQVAAPLVEAVDLSETARSAWATEHNARVTMAKQPSFSVESVTGRVRRDGVIREDDPARALRGPDAGVEWGELVHKLLEYAMKRGGASRSDLERVAKWIAFDRPGLHPAIPSAIEAVEAAMTSDLWQRATASRERHVEVPFAVGDQPDGRVPTVLHGVIDLVYRTEDGWDIIDYKTDQVADDGSSLVERYRSQLVTYGNAWRSAVGETGVVRLGIHAIRAGKTHWLTY